MELNDHILDKCRELGDPEADNLVQELFDRNIPDRFYAIMKVPLAELKAFKSGHEPLDRFLLARPEEPTWLDKEKLVMAGKFYETYAQEVMMFLGAVSLPYCYAAFPGNKVLYLSEKMAKKPGKRLLDTASFVIQVCSQGAFDTSRMGFMAVQQTRLIHAMIRHHLRHHKEWDLADGIPVNMEDMAGTNLAFSYKAVSSFSKVGLRPSEEQLNAFLHLWKWIGYQMGIPETVLPENMVEAVVLEKAIIRRNFRVSEEGKFLAKSLVDHYNEALPLGLGKLVESQMVHFIGPEIVDMLELKTSPARSAIVSSLTGIQAMKNRIFPVKPSYQRMLREHERLKKMYA